MSVCPKVFRRSKPLFSTLNTIHFPQSVLVRPLLIHTSAINRQAENSSNRVYVPPNIAQPATSKGPPVKTEEPPKERVAPAKKQFAKFDVSGRVYLVTGGAQGLGLALAEGLVEAGGKVYCIDHADKPAKEWHDAQARVVPEWGGSLHYRQQDVSDEDGLDALITAIAEENQGLNGVIAAAGIQQVTPATDYKKEDAIRMLDVNYTGVLLTATAAARQMIRYKNRGSICLIASMSGSIANKGLLSPVYNSSKAAVIQLARNLAMEWSRAQDDGTGGIRVNCLSPGHILTPMVLQNFEDDPSLRRTWEKENMMGRLADTSDFKGAALFLMSDASSFMTGNNLVVDGGHTAW